MLNLSQWIHAKFRALAWLSCYATPRPDVLAGFTRWRWLASQRRAGRLIEPTVRIFGNLQELDSRLLLAEGITMDLGVMVWLGAQKGRIEVGAGTYLGPYCYLGTCDHLLRIGSQTMIGAGSYLITANHVTKRQDIPYNCQGYEGADIEIGSNVWLGAHVTVLPGVSIGDHAVVGAGAVVTKDVPTGETWAGVPAKRI